MFLSNKHSFLLVKSVISKPIIQSGIHPVRGRPAEGAATTAVGRSVSNGIQESAISLTPSSLSDSGRKMFLSNKHSFLLVRSVILKPVIQSGIQGSTTSEPSSSSSVYPAVLGSEEPSGSRREPGRGDSGKPTIVDKNKRAFLKAAGVAVTGIAASLFLPTKKAEALIMGSSPTTGVVGVKDASNTRINPATEETAASILKTSDLTFDTGSVEVKVTSMPSSSSSFSDSTDVAKSGLVDADRHVQVDVLSSALPTSASTEGTLETISFGGTKFALRLAENSGDSDIEYVGEANVGTATSAASWRIKKIDSSSGIIIQWADGDASFDNIWDNRESLSYS